MAKGGRVGLKSGSKGCKLAMKGKRKSLRKEFVMRTYYSKGGGLREWVKQNWVDIANKKSDGSYPKCGRSGGEKRKNYPKCVPIAKARAMSKGQRAGAKKKTSKANAGPTPSRAATFAKKKKKKT